VIHTVSFSSIAWQFVGPYSAAKETWKAVHASANGVFADG